MSNEDRLFAQILDALRQSETRFRHLTEYATDVIFTVTVDGRLISVNKAAESLFGYARENFIGRSIFDLIAPEHRELARRMITEKLGSQASAPYTIDVVPRSGERIPLEVSTQVIYDGGLPLAVQGIGRVVSDRQRTSATLQEREHFYRSLVEHSADILVVLDAEQIVRYLSPSFQAVLGYDPNEVLGTTGLQFVHEEDLARAGEAMSTALNTAESVSHELRVRHANGEYRFIDVHIRNLLGDPLIRGIVLDCRDVTDRKDAEQALRVSEQRLRKLLETSGEGIAVRGADGRLTFANERFAEILGYTVDELIGWPIERVVAPSSQGILRESFERRRRTGHSESLDLQLVHRNGTLVDVILAASPMYDERGEFVGALGMITDITERKRLETQLRQSQKMEAVGRLAGGIAHDFNNLLTAIRGHVELMMGELPPDSPLRADCEQINRAAERAAGLTQQLLAFSRKQMLQPIVLEIDDEVRAVERLLRNLLPPEIELIVTSNAPGGRIRADRSQIEQVLTNLVLNARDAMNDGGVVRVSTDLTRLNDAFVRDNPGAKPGDYVRIAVSDTGVGMDAQTLARVFEPFFTTKGVGRGSGLGLSTVYGVVKQSEGYVRGASTPGAGSMFEVYLPSVQEPVPERRTTHDGTQNGDAGATILVAEDEDAVRALTCRILRKRGYQVLEARDGREALDIARDFDGDIHLVVTDVIMPRVGGRELSEGLSRMMPSVKVLFMSGYTDDQLLQRGILQSGNRNFLEKPFTPEGLARKVREVLESE